MLQLVAARKACLAASLMWCCHVWQLSLLLLLLLPWLLLLLLLQPLPPLLLLPLLQLLLPLSLLLL